MKGRVTTYFFSIFDYHFFAIFENGHIAADQEYCIFMSSILKNHHISPCAHGAFTVNKFFPKIT